MTTDPTDAIRLIQSGLDKLGHCLDSNFKCNG